MHGVLTPRLNKSAPESLPAADKGGLGGGSSEGSVLDPRRRPASASSSLRPHHPSSRLHSHPRLHLDGFTYAPPPPTPGTFPGFRGFNHHSLPPPTPRRTCDCEFHAPVATVFSSPVGTSKRGEASDIFSPRVFTKVNIQQSRHVRALK